MPHLSPQQFDEMLIHLTEHTPSAPFPWEWPNDIWRDIPSLAKVRNPDKFATKVFLPLLIKADFIRPSVILPSARDQYGRKVFVWTSKTTTAPRQFYHE